MVQGTPIAKLPRNYQVVLDVVNALEPGDHATAGSIFERAKRIQGSIGYSTVYRALDRLCGTGLVVSVRVPGSTSTLFEAARAIHAHFQCRTCQQVFDIDHALPPEQLSKVAADHDLTIDTVDMHFSGQCAACRTDGAGGGRIDARTAPVTSDAARSRGRPKIS